MRLQTIESMDQDHHRLLLVYTRDDRLIASIPIGSLDAEKINHELKNENDDEVIARIVRRRATEEAELQGYERSLLQEKVRAEEELAQTKLKYESAIQVVNKLQAERERFITRVVFALQGVTKADELLPAEISDKIDNEQLKKIDTMKLRGSRGKIRI